LVRQKILFLSVDNYPWLLKNGNPDRVARLDQGFFRLINDQDLILYLHRFPCLNEFPVCGTHPWWNSSDNSINSINPINSINRHLRCHRISWLFKSFCYYQFLCEHKKHTFIFLT
jgi:hypothetical protein